MDLRPGMIVVTEGGTGWTARAIRWFTRSRWTHTFMLLDEFYGIEAWYPDGVREFRLDERFAELEREGRDFVVLDHPQLQDGLTGEMYREQLIWTAMQYLGRKYDVLQIVYFALFRRFIDDGPLRVICTRLETAIYQDALGWPLFTPDSFTKHGTSESRRWQLAQGWATPGEMIEDSVLEPVSTATSDNLHEDYEEHYEDVELYTTVSAEHAVLKAQT